LLVHATALEDSDSQFKKKNLDSLNVDANSLSNTKTRRCRQDPGVYIPNLIDFDPTVIPIICSRHLAVTQNHNGGGVVGLQNAVIRQLLEASSEGQAQRGQRGLLPYV